jgi:hypothetical protein
VAGLDQVEVTTLELKVREAVVTTMEEGAMEEVSSVTDRITGAEVVAEAARRVVLMLVLGTRGLTMVLGMLVIVGVAHQQLLVHPQSEGQRRCTSLGVLFRGPQIQSRHRASSKDSALNRVFLFLITIYFAGNKKGEMITNCRIHTISHVALVLAFDQLMCLFFL